MTRSLIITISVFLSLSFLACKTDTPKVVEKKAAPAQEPERLPTDYSLPKWAKNANVYKVNLRHYTSEGTFDAFIKELPRLKTMGIDILCLMPIFPVNTTANNSTGTNYAVTDFKGVNPDFGDMKTFDKLVAAIHEERMHVIIDWNNNYTSNDHPWVAAHADWYKEKVDGAVIAKLNHDNVDMQTAMIGNMGFWVNERGIDGFNMIESSAIPNNFWKDVRDSLFAYRKHLFLMSDSDVGEHRNSRFFHATTSIKMQQLMEDIAQGKKKASDIDSLMRRQRKDFKKGFHVYYSSDAELNSINGTVEERMGDAHKTIAAFLATYDGMPQFYGGQEEPLTKRLALNEKDDIGFQNYAYADFYAKLNHLKHRNAALWNGRHGGRAEKLLIDNDNFYGFIRAKGKKKVIGLFNLSNEVNVIKVEVGLRGNDVYTNRQITWMPGEEIRLKPWQFFLLEK